MSAGQLRTGKMALRLLVLFTKVLYDKHFYGRSLAEFNNVEIDTKCKICGAVEGGEGGSCTSSTNAVTRRWSEVAGGRTQLVTGRCAWQR